MQTKKIFAGTIIWILTCIGAYNMFVPNTFDARWLLYGIWHKTGDVVYYTWWKVNINTDNTWLILNLPNNGVIKVNGSVSNLVTGALTYGLHAGTYSLLGIDTKWLRTIHWPSWIETTKNEKWWWDGTYAVSCDAYRHPSKYWDTTHVYKGAVWNGNYLVDPDHDGTPEFSCDCDMSITHSNDVLDDYNGSCTEINGGYSKLNYSKLDYSKLELISYSKWWWVWKQNMKKFAVYKQDGNRYRIVADNIDLDKDGKAEWCRENISWLNQNYCILYTASAWLKRFISSPSGGSSDVTKNYNYATNYCSNYSKFGLSWFLPSLGTTSDCDNYSNDWADQYESCLIYRYWQRDNGSSRSNYKIVWLNSSRYWTSTHDWGSYRYDRFVLYGGPDYNVHRVGRSVRCIAQ